MNRFQGIDFAGWESIPRLLKRLEIRALYSTNSVIRNSACLGHIRNSYAVYTKSPRNSIQFTAPKKVPAQRIHHLSFETRLDLFEALHI